MLHHVHIDRESELKQRSSFVQVEELTRVVSILGWDKAKQTTKNLALAAQPCRCLLYSFLLYPQLKITEKLRLRTDLGLLLQKVGPHSTTFRTEKNSHKQKSLVKNCLFERANLF